MQGLGLALYLAFPAKPQRQLGTSHAALDKSI